MAETKAEQHEPIRTARDRLLVAAVVLLGLLISLIVTQVAWSYRDSILRRQLAEAAREIENNLSRQAGAVEAFVETVASFVEASSGAGQADFMAFVRRTAGRWPGLVAVEWQAWVPGPERAAFEERMRADGLADFRIVERDGTGRLVPAAAREVHLPIVHVFSTGDTAAQIGLDLAASGEWFRAKFEALAGAHAVASPPFGIVSAEGRNVGEGFSISDAVLRPGPGEPRERLRGFVSAVFAYQPMIQAAMDGTRVSQLRVTLEDEASAIPIYLSWSVDEGGNGRTVEGMHAISSFTVAGRMWKLTVAPTRSLFSSVILVLPWYVLGTGCVLTLATTVVVMWRQRLRLERDAQAQARLAVEKRFHDIVDRMSGAVILMRGDEDGGRFTIVDLNEAAGVLLARDRAGAIGRDLVELLPGADAAGLLATLRRAWRSGGLQRVEHAELRHQERIHHLDAAFFRVGAAGEICGVLQDLTDLKVAERDLRQARNELELALDVSNVGLWSWEIAMKRVRLDSRCARLYGRSGADVIDDVELTSRIHADDLRNLREEVARALEESRSYEVEYRFTMPDGTLRHLCSRARPVREDGAAATKIVGCTWDVTERRRMEEHLRRSQRLESLGTLAGGVAHDLNNALAPVTMGLDLLRRRLAADAESAESIKLMQSSVRRASTIVRQLIAFKRGASETRQPAPAHPKRILEVLGATLTESFPKEIEVIIEPVSLDLPRAVTDEREAHQILLNLCVNARDAMPQGGRLTIASELLEVGPESQSRHPELRPGCYIVFRVADTGTGIPAEIRHRVFDPFFTTKDVGKGSGLGLSTALGIVKAHRGAIQFESREGAGTAFQVFIPAAADDEPPPTVPIPAAESMVESQRRCLLLVDDEAQVRELSRRALEQTGYKVLTAANGREAVDVFTKHLQGVDAVIMDLLMPVMNGAAATAAIKRLRPEVPIIGASGFATDALVDEARRAGISTFLPKPFTIAVLVDAVREAIYAARDKA